MRKIFFFLSIAFMLTACEVKEEVTYDADTLEEIVSRFVDRGITRDTFTPHTRIQTWYGTILVTPDYDCRIIFLDPTGLGGDHKCTYLFLDVNTGKWETIESMGCIPIAYEGQAIDYEFTQPLPHDLHSLTKSVFSDSIYPIEHIMQQSASMQNASNIYAVIINAGGNPYENKSFYVEDCVNYYTFLKRACGIPQDHIYVLMGDGLNPDYDYYDSSSGFHNTPADLDSDGVDDILFSATQVNLQSVYNAINSVSSDGDILLLYVNGPFTYEEGWTANIMHLWNNDPYDRTTFGHDLDVLKRKMTINILFQSSHSSYFVDSSLIGGSGTVISSCLIEEDAYQQNAQDYASFTSNWIDYISNHPGRSIFDAYSYASSLTENHPVYLSVPYDYGNTHSFLGNSVSQPYMSGPEILPDNSIITYHLHNAPDGSNVTWTVGEGITIQSYSNSQLTIATNLSQPYTLNSYVRATIPGYEGISQTVSIWKSGTVVASDFLTHTGSSTFGTISIPSQYVFDGYFQWVTDPGFSPIIQGQYFTDYEGDTMASDFNVAVRFLTPLNEYLTIIQNIVF